MIFILCLLILIAFSIVFIILVTDFKITKSSITAKDLAGLISVCITFLALIVGILKIITTYVFPEHEEEYITRIVEAIQKNDLENKKENIRIKCESAEKIHEEMKADIDNNR